MSERDVEALWLLKDEIFYATDRLSSSEAKAVAHAVYNGDWLAAHVAAARAEAWDEGWCAGVSRFTQRDLSTMDNPYRRDA